MESILYKSNPWWEEDYKNEENNAKKRVKYYSLLEIRYYQKSSRLRVKSQKRILQERES